MGARTSEETKQAIKLFQEGMPVYKAAIQCGIYPSTLYNALVRLGLHTPAKRGAKRAEPV